MGYHRLALPDLGRIFRGETVTGLSEWQLLERYLERHDEAAFESLVTRHGPMVLGVCRRMLDDHADVEDAFQATFLVLVRRARQLGPRDAIGPWLYGVAARVALRARSQTARRRRLEPTALEFPAAAPDDMPGDPELRAVLDQELSRLPSKYRSPLVLCYLEGRTHEEAAQQLEWPLGTVKGRLARARDLLRSRLARRGLAPAAGALTFLQSPDATAALHGPLVERTVRSSLKLAAAHSASQVVSASIHALVEGVLTSMVLNKLKWASLAVLVAGLTLTGVGGMARQDAAKPQPAPSPPVLKALDARAGPEAARKTVISSPGGPPMLALAGGPAPEPASDARQQLLEAARSAYQATWEAFRNGHAAAEQVYDASRRWMGAQDEDSSGSAAKAAAGTAHLERMRDLLRVEGDRPHFPSKPAELGRVKAYVSEARFWLAQTTTGPTVKDSPKKGEAIGEQGDGRGQDPRSRQIITVLEEPISMSFANETPLDDVLKYIKQATTKPTYSGIPIYVDPVGMQEAERSLTSTINIDLEGVPLRRTLQLVLAQLGLVYFVEDGILIITSKDSAGTPLPPSMNGATPLMEKLEKAERGDLGVKEIEDLLKYLKARETLLRQGLHVAEAEPEGKSEGKAEATPKQDQMDLLLKEMRELIELMKSERQVKKAPEGK